MPRSDPSIQHGATANESIAGCFFLVWNNIRHSAVELGMSWDRDCTILVMNVHDNIKLNGIAELDLLDERSTSRALLILQRCGSANAGADRFWQGGSGLRIEQEHSQALEISRAPSWQRDNRTCRARRPQAGLMKNRCIGLVPRWRSIAMSAETQFGEDPSLRLRCHRLPGWRP